MKRRYQFIFALTALLTIAPLAPAFAADTVKPVMGTITPVTATRNVATEYSLSVSDDVAIRDCYFYVASKRVGQMTVSSGTARYSHAFTVSGRHYVYALCYDTSGNFKSSPYTSINVTGSAADDQEDPEMGSLLPNYATAGIPVRMHTDVEDDTGIESCTFYPLAGNSVPMELGDDEAFVMYTFNVAGVRQAYALCKDIAGNFSSTAVVDITVYPGYPAEEAAEPGTLVKMECPPDVYVNDPCTTVYYYADDGKRHPFTNERSYFSWFSDYSTLDIVSNGFMAALPLGDNVTYKPGYKMVKFPTDNRVYMVSRGAVLRPVADENTAIAFYGSTWNLAIDDISDAFYLDYTFGDTVYDTDDYDPAEESEVALIDDNFAN